MRRSPINDDSGAPRRYRQTALHGAAPPAQPPWVFDIGDGPVVATAIHSGHEVREDVAAWMSIPEADRLREEDPLTGFWTAVGDSSIRVFRSRFEFDLNRPRDKAIAILPEDCWGLTIWREPPPRPVVERSLAQYDEFYRLIAELLDDLLERWRSVLVLDLHSYNHRRDGPENPAASDTENPEINVGTGTMDRGYWSYLVDAYVAALRKQTFRQRPLDVRENVKFMGGYFPQWLHATYPERVCVLSLEFKKFFMDEWRATADIEALEELRIALRQATAAVRPALAEYRGPAA